MMRLHVFCEGQTEASFVQELLAPHLAHLNCWVNAILVATGPSGKGGVTGYGKIRRQIIKKCREDTSSFVTTMFDFYGLPADFPGMKNNLFAKDTLERAGQLIQAFQNDIAQANFLANLIVPEFEALLFSKPETFAVWFDNEQAVSELCAIRNRHISPEHIAISQNNPPSRRILDLCPDYDKIMHGSLLALEIGLATMRAQCSYFHGWLTKLELLAMGRTRI